MRREGPGFPLQRPWHLRPAQWPRAATRSLAISPCSAVPPQARNPLCFVSGHGVRAVPTEMASHDVQQLEHICPGAGGAQPCLGSSHTPQFTIWFQRQDRPHEGCASPGEGCCEATAARAAVLRVLLLSHPLGCRASSPPQAGTMVVGIPGTSLSPARSPASPWWN